MNSPLDVLREGIRTPELFREHVQNTARRTGLRGELVEKDFYCSLILGQLAEPFRPAVAFKGGTCLSKVYARFYRLSEDLDFAISMETGAPRAERSERMLPVRVAFKALPVEIPTLEVSEPLRGANESRQYIGSCEYRSVISGDTERVRIEVSLREPLLLPAKDRSVSTLLQNAFTGEAMVAPFGMRVIAAEELWAEKVRAALTRRDPAIRDFFDLDYAAQNLGLDLMSAAPLSLAKRKLAVPGNDPVDVSDGRLKTLQNQVERQLRPVLRQADFVAFSLDRIWTKLLAANTALARADKANEV